MAPGTKKLSVNFPGGTAVVSLLGFFFFLSLLSEELFSPETRWDMVLAYCIFLTLIGLFLGRFLFSPRIYFDEDGVHIKRRGETEFVPFHAITSLRLVSPTLANIDRKHQYFALYYRDAFDVPHRVKFMLRYYQYVFDSDVIIHAFLESAKEANPDFVFSYKPLSYP